MMKLKKRYVPDVDAPVGFAHDIRSANACHKLLLKCSYLDPRFKNQISKENQTTARALLTRETLAAPVAPETLNGNKIIF